MFGYILPEKPELKIKEYELFRAYYCGVCKSIGRRLGQIPRLTLNYDTTFLAVLLSSLVGEPLSVVKERCIAHPVKKRMILINSEAIDYASDITILLAYYNLKDNWVDEKSLPSAAVMLAIRSSFRKLRKKYAEQCTMIERRLDELATLEKQKCRSMDAAAEPFAKLMEEIMAYKPFCKEEQSEKKLRWIGYHIGKWIYILDAYDDLEKDLKKGTYNPLLQQYEQKQHASFEDFRKKIRGRVEFNLTYTLSEIAKAYELLEVKGNTGILENIIYMGMLRKTENILNIGSCKKSEKSV